MAPCSCISQHGKEKRVCAYVCGREGGPWILISTEINVRALLGAWGVQSSEEQQERTLSISPLPPHIRTLHTPPSNRDNPHLQDTIQFSIHVEQQLAHTIHLSRDPASITPTHHASTHHTPTHHHSSATNKCSELVIVTGANGAMFSRVENLVGSIHYWQKQKSRILVYDFGFDPEDAEEVRTKWRYVRYRKFPCEAYPEHVCRMGDRCSYAFKAMILNEVLEDHECVLWLDSGFEVRYSMDEIAEIIAEKGHFYVTNGWEWPNRFVHPGEGVWGREGVREGVRM